MKKGVIRSDLPVYDDVEYGWNSSEAIARVKEWASDGDGNIDFSKYRKAFFWVDPEDTEKQGSYKLPFADVTEGELRAVWRGVSAAMGALLGARGGVDIPDEEKQDAYNQIAKYFGKFDKEPPEMKSVSAKPDFLHDEKSGLDYDMLCTKAKIVEKDGDTFTAIASTNVEDRHNEVVDNNGWMLNNFKKAPRILWAHDHMTPAIGKATKVWLDGKGKDAKLTFKMVFQEVTELGRALKQLAKDGFIDTFSVGFKPFDMDGNTFTKQELLEISLVNVPANPEAMMLAYKSLKKSGFEDEVIKGLGIPVEVIDKIERLEKDMAKLNQKIEEVAKAKTVNPQEPRRVVNERLSMLKVIARASDKLLEGEKKNLPKSDRIDLTKVVKHATEHIIKEDLAKVR